MTREREWDRANAEAGIMPLSEYVRKYGAEPGKGAPGSREESHRRQLAQREAMNNGWRGIFRRFMEAAQREFETFTIHTWSILFGLACSVSIFALAVWEVLS